MPAGCLLCPPAAPLVRQPDAQFGVQKLLMAHAMREQIRNVVTLLNQGKEAPPDAKTVPLGDGNNVVVHPGTDMSSVMHRNLFLPGERISMNFYLSEDPDASNFSAMSLVWANHTLSCTGDSLALRAPEQA